MNGDGNAPAASIPEHAHRGQRDCAVHLLQPMRILEQRSQKQAADEPGQEDEPADETRFPPVFVFSLKGAQLLMNLAQGFSVDRPKNMRADDLAAVYFHFEHGVDIHVVKKDEFLPPCAIGLHVLVRIHRLPKTGNDKGGKRKRFASLCLMLANQPTRVGHIHLHQAVDEMFLFSQPSAVRHQAADLWKGDNLIRLILHGSCSQILPDDLHSVADAILGADRLSD